MNKRALWTKTIVNAITSLIHPCGGHKAAAQIDDDVIRDGDVVLIRGEGLWGSPSKVRFRFAWQGFSRWRRDHRFGMLFVSLVSSWDRADVSCSVAG